MARRVAGDVRTAVAAASGALKAFPLQGVVVFPGTPTPFHVFEPRYRALVKDALEGDRILVVPTLAEAADAPLAVEPVRPIAGACHIDDHEELPDGRYHILVRGLARVRLVEERPLRKLYREFRAELLDDVLPEGGEAALEPQVEAVEQLLLQVAAGLPPESGAPKLATDAAKRSPSGLADLVAAALVTDPEARYAILAELDVRRRLELVTAEAAAVVLAIGGTGGAQA